METDEQTLAFARSYKPKDDIDRYQWVIRYAEDKIALLIKSLEAMDGKAETLMRYLGGAAIGLTGLLPLVFQGNFDLAWLLLPSVVTLLLGAWKAGQSSAPQEFPGPPQIHKAFNFADAYNDSAKIRFYASWVPLEEKLKALMDKKWAAYHQSLKCLWMSIGWAAGMTFIISILGVDRFRQAMAGVNSFF